MAWRARLTIILPASACTTTLATLLLPPTPNILFLKQIQYSSDSESWFRRLSAWPHPVWLDSNSSDRGRFDILTADPDDWFTLEAGQSSSAQARGFLDSLRRYAKPYSSHHLPFSGGFIGLLSYDFGRALLGLEPSPTCDIDQALAEAGWYSWAVIQDHKQRAAWFVSRQSPLAARTTLNDILALATPQTGACSVMEQSEAVPNRQGYASAFNKIQEYILNGDCYQINFSRRYRAPYHGDERALYTRLRKVSSAPFSAYFQGRDSVCLSLSPERFVALENETVLTQPIKGTAARSDDPALDKEHARQLQNSSKDKAENLMIVDLLRNDLGRVCEAGSIKVPKLFELQSFASVHHLVSTIVGKLAKNQDGLSLLEATFPGGSITGAPKHRAMEIIDELESRQRSIYCGSIFYLSADGKLDSNILIRSFLAHNGQLYAWGGGGLVHDSTAAAEWTEIEHKIGRLLSAC